MAFAAGHFSALHQLLTRTDWLRLVAGSVVFTAVVVFALYLQGNSLAVMVFAAVATAIACVLALTTQLAKDRQRKQYAQQGSSKERSLVHMGSDTD